ncbi:Rv1733c family protein [Streptomyces sp. H39-S7]|uniref:Rv1733c family protein n=1 Tax=Streptomyces sp. H39-S7 TaxID=3004357 RepID=UPI0022AFE781|nr:hypothetical protein [Streptomyces sp. H39-S7]MCZ4122754.1 hypothetical protein [Streptomyces sp. H39-S7]
MSSEMRLWRWRRNPLRRGSDVAEAWLVLVAGVLLVAGAPAVGAATAVGVQAAMLRESRDWHRTTAVLTKDAPSTATPYKENGQVRATVRWTASDGALRTGRALVEPDTRSGTRTTVWLDEHGALRNPPSSPGVAAAQGIGFGALAATGAGLLVLGGRWAVRVRLDRHRAAEWESEWVVVAPQWGRRTP